MRNLTPPPLATLSLIGFLAGCSGTPDAMNRMAERFRADVETSLKASNISRANNVAIASCFFAREMEAAGVKVSKPADPKRKTPPSRDPGSKSGVVFLGNGIVETSKAFEMIEKIVLDPKQNISGLNAENYQTILGWVLSPRDLDILKQIREREGYWDKLRATFEK